MASSDYKGRGLSMNAAELAAMESGAVGFTLGVPDPAPEPAPAPVADPVEAVQADAPAEPVAVAIGQPTN